jgi:uncharacterized membrane protein YbhN (UPF0104 family)
MPRRDQCSVVFRNATIRNMLIAATLIGFALVFLRSQLAPAGDLLGRLSSVDPRLAGMGLAVSSVAIVNRGLTNRAAHAAVGLDAGVGEMTRTSAVAFAAQKFVKSAGAVGLAVFVRHGRRRDRAAGAVATACVLTAVGAFVGLGVVLAVTIGVLASAGRLTGWWLAAAAGFGLWSLLVVVVGAALVRGHATAAWLWTRIQRVRRSCGRLAPEATDPPMPTAVFDALDRSRRQRGALAGLVAHCVLGKVLGAAMLAVALVAAGVRTDPTEILVVYATALAACLVSILPGGIGAVEGSTMAVLVAGGADPAAAVLAIGLFRAFDLWLPLLVGAALARSEARAPADERTSDPVIASISASISASIPASSSASSSASSRAPFSPAIEPPVLVAAAA